MSLWSLELRLVVRGAEGDARAAVESGVAQPVLELETKVHPKVRNHGEGPY